MFEMRVGVDKASMRLFKICVRERESVCMARYDMSKIKIQQKPLKKGFASNL